MNRATHTATSVPSHMALLSVRIHVKDHYIDIPACEVERGSIVSHALPTQAMPSITGINMRPEIESKLEKLDQIISELENLNNDLQTLIDELDKDPDDE